MRFINAYLIGYFILVLGALAALWYGGALRHISAGWIVIGLVIALRLGIMLSVSGGKPEITREEADRLGVASERLWEDNRWPFFWQSTATVFPALRKTS